jgi:YD repeat-containing protein
VDQAIGEVLVAQPFSVGPSPKKDWHVSEHPDAQCPTSENRQGIAAKSKREYRIRSGLVTQSSDAPDTAHVSYDGAGRLTALQAANGCSQHWRYDETYAYACACCLECQRGRTSSL